mmetsp:Transcript_52043/g.119748  ORF Transcript_52043/g.119748 Transcript_52043/m.119748 type:complete len:144 (+) Transcript_52043:1835-2266(+)
MSRAMRSRCRDAFLQRPLVGASAAQKELTDVLADLGAAPIVEFETEIGYTLDAVVEWRGVRIGVEFDGPKHFMIDTGEPMGRKMLKRRQLRAFGWSRLLSVSYLQWSNVPLYDGTSTRRERQRKLVEFLLDSACTGNEHSRRT